MGASLPVLARQVADDPERIGGKVGLLYAVNTFGAVLGVFISGFVAIPGHRRAKHAVDHRSGQRPARPDRDPAGRQVQAGHRGDGAGGADPLQAPTPAKIRLALLVFGLSGFGALVLEVAWTRVLALVMGSSVYAFSLMLLAFLIGLALGSAFSRAVPAPPAPRPTRRCCWRLLLAAAGVLAYATAFLFQALPRLFAEIFFAVPARTPTAGSLVQLCLRPAGHVPGDLRPGRDLPAVLQIHARSLDKVASSVGTVYASNTVGTIVGAAVAGFVLIPRLGVLTR